MRLGTFESLIIIAMLVIGTVTTRALPFLLFPSARQSPPFIKYLGKVLPFAMIGFLVIYCLKDVSVVEPPYGFPEFISIAFIVALHLWRGNTLLSIGAGTAAYMFLITLF